MVEIDFAGKTIFQFKDSNFVQIIGQNKELKRHIVSLYLKVFNGYKFSDTDMETMNGYYPEIRKGENTYKKNDITVFYISNMDDINKHLHIKKDSILFRYLLSLGEDLIINEFLGKVEEDLTQLSIELDKLLDEKMQTGSISLITNVDGVDFKEVVKSFITVEFVDRFRQRKSLWLSSDMEVIDLFLNIIRLIIFKNDNITFILDGLDDELSGEIYDSFIDKIYNLTLNFPNFKVWLLPNTEKGIYKNYNIFNNTYILGENIICMGDFDLTYESICRNYPDNNLPSKMEVLETLLGLFPFHHKNKKYFPSKKIIILQLYLKLLQENPAQYENIVLSSLEAKFLTSL